MSVFYKTKCFRPTSNGRDFSIINALQLYVIMVLVVVCLYCKKLRRPIDEGTRIFFQKLKLHCPLDDRHLSPAPVQRDV